MDKIEAPSTIDPILIFVVVGILLVLWAIWMVTR